MIPDTKQNKSYAQDFIQVFVYCIEGRRFYAKLSLVALGHNPFLYKNVFAHLKSDSIFQKLELILRKLYPSSILA